MNYRWLQLPIETLTSRLILLEILKQLNAKEQIDALMNELYVPRHARKEQ